MKDPNHNNSDRNNSDRTVNYRMPKRPYRRPPQVVSNLLTSTLRRYGIDKDIARYEFVLHWPAIMGEHIAKRTKPEALDNGVLTVRVCNSEWAQELVFQKQIIVARLNRFLSDRKSGAKVHDVRFIVGDVG